MQMHRSRNLNIILPNPYGFLIISNGTFYLDRCLFEVNYQAILHPVSKDICQMLNASNLCSLTME